MASGTRRRGALRFSACGLALVLASAAARGAEEPAHSAALDEAIIKSAARHGVPEKLVRRIVMRESRYNPAARNHKYWGLMQISYPTAKSMGFHGTPQELLNPVVNLRYAVPYLANAFIIAGKREDAAIRLYASGYYETAKRRGLLGMLRTADSAPLHGVPDDPDVAATPAPAPPPPQESTGIFGALFGPSEMPRDPQTQQAVFASAAPPTQSDVQPDQQAAAAPPDGKASDDVDLVADSDGTLHPPKAWQTDGGTTVIARGEQSIEQVAAYEKAVGTPDDRSSSRHRHARKTAVFASLDTPPAGAQAYAAVAGGQDPRLMQAESQAAIAQATAGQPAPTEVAGAAGTPAAAAPDAIAQTPSPDIQSKPLHKRRVARKSHHHADEPETDVAAQPPASSPPQEAPQAAADPQAAPPQADPAAQPVQAADAAQPDTAAAPQQAADSAPQPDEDAKTSRKHQHHAHRGHARKTTDVAIKAPDDAKAPTQPSPAQ